MIPVLSDEEKLQGRTTLLCVVQALRDKTTVLELRQENAVEGKIVHVDCKMNVTLSNARLFRCDGEVLLFDHFYISGKQIMYVHIPKGVENIMTLMKHQIGLCGGPKLKAKLFEQNKTKKEKTDAAIARRVAKLQQK